MCVGVCARACVRYLHLPNSYFIPLASIKYLLVRVCWKRVKLMLSLHVYIWYGHLTI